MLSRWGCLNSINSSEGNPKIENAKETRINWKINKNNIDQIKKAKERILCFYIVFNLMA
jgi:hypothetical protein